jgi:serine/threonine-protein kinase HipA
VAKPALDVQLHGKHAGVLLQKDNGNLQFRYDDNYIAESGPPLSIRLPLSRDAYPHRDCLAFFGNLLPEEDVRDQVALIAGISSGNDYKLLERIGGDVAGAVTLIPAVVVGDQEVEDEPEPGQIDILSPQQLDKLLMGLPERPLAVDEDGKIRISLAGAQSKLPVIEVGSSFALPLGSAHPTTHILKPEPSRFPGLVTNEFFCMRLAGEAGLTVAPVRQAETESGLPFLIVTRYDRDLKQDPIRRLHQEDLCQALGRLSIQKYQNEGGPSVSDAIGLIDNYSAVPARDREQFWLALVFNFLIGNCDAHGKNYSLLYDSTAPSLAPLYDLVSTAVYEMLTTRVAMSINGATYLEDVDAKAWARLASEVGVAPRFLRERTIPFAQRVATLAVQLSKGREYAHLLVEEMVAGIIRRSEILHFGD